ncbi:MAG: universal stress protein [Pseudomonadota bacterium]
MGFEKILFHTQFREMSLEALSAVLTLKAVGLKEIVLVAVIPRDDVAFVPYGGYDKAGEDRVREEMSARFEPYLSAVTAAGLSARMRIDCGIVNAVVLDIAKTEAVDLIVTGRKKRSLMEHIYVGGHTLDLIRRSPVPILMGKFMVEIDRGGMAETRINDRPFRHPLLATDFSEPSRRALAHLAGLKGLAEHVTVVHAIGQRRSQGMTDASITALEAESRKLLNAAVSRLINAGIPADGVLCRGRTVAQIIKAASDAKASAIVMGRTGKDWLQEYWLGGVSHQVAEMAPLPVLLVP